jgi:hypothetical protein
VNPLVRTGLALGALAATAAISMPVPVAAGPVRAVATAEDEPLEAAGRAAQSLSFVGVLQVRWSEGGLERSESPPCTAPTGR